MQQKSPRRARSRAARLALAALASLSCLAAPPPALAGQARPGAKPVPPKKPGAVVAPGTIGTKQMEGTEGTIGVTYSLKEGENFTTPRFNITLTGVAYTVLPRNAGGTVLAPNRGQKYLVVRYVCQNPNREDITLAGYRQALELFQAVGSDNRTYAPEGAAENAFFGGAASHAPGKQHADADVTLKPGQKSEPVFAVIPVPADVTVPKLVLRKGRVGTKEQVVRFDLRGKVASEFGPFVDPANPAVPLAQVAATPGTAYPLATLELTASDFKREAGPQLTPDVVAEDGKEFLTLVVTIKNLGPDPRSLFSDYRPVVVLEDEDGEKTTFDAGVLKTNRTGEISLDTKAEPAETRKGLFYFAVPKGARYRRVLIHEWNFPDFETRRLVYDVSGL